MAGRIKFFKKAVAGRYSVARYVKTPHKPDFFRMFIRKNTNRRFSLVWG
jgi:hypothetical protein